MADADSHGGDAGSKGVVWAALMPSSSASRVRAAAATPWPGAGWPQQVFDQRSAKRVLTAARRCSSTRPSLS